MNTKLSPISAYLVKSFTDNPNLGNPTLVVLNADKLSDHQMQKIAQHYNFSEIVFVLKSEVADIKTKFFTPTQEVNYCAHATLAALHALGKMGSLTQESNKKITRVHTTYNTYSDTMEKFYEIEFDNVTGSRIFIDDCPSVSIVSYALGILEEDIWHTDYHSKETDYRNKESNDYDLSIWNAGNPKLIVPIKDLRTLLSLKPNMNAIKQLSLMYNFNGIYTYTTKVIDSSADFSTRQFNPLQGINEDPITGIAAAAFGGYIKSNNITNRFGTHDDIDKSNIIIEQGFSMNAYGQMHLNIENTIKVGGYCVTYGDKTQEIIDLLKKND